MAYLPLVGAHVIDDLLLVPIHLRSVGRPAYGQSLMVVGTREGQWDLVCPICLISMAVHYGEKGTPLSDLSCNDLRLGVTSCTCLLHSGSIYFVHVWSNVAK